MIEIIKEHVNMPKLSDRRFQLSSPKIKFNKWIIMDTKTDTIRYVGSFENTIIACHNLNKKFYKEEVYL